MDESRKAFEQWYLLNWGHTEDNHGSLFDIDTDYDCYYRLGVRMAYEAWQASRAAIDIALPEIEKWRSVESVRAQIAYRSRVRDEVIAAGIKVKE